jgi:hypothetical protein
LLFELCFNEILLNLNKLECLSEFDESHRSLYF